MALNVPNKEFGFQTITLEESHRGGSSLLENILNSVTMS